ncbi:hypothetical protein [Nocardia sp. alder85J]|uniref:hypothetical protein n=1 Tax=Nocardia sp. alder85J TaxID=2862949 RepID=UPI001CD77E17|nr:hypothetical protein [Nocardia sp. alder85J]MCX4093961.1 hypothetical protein [Nocardia sp. alder85J]
MADSPNGSARADPKTWKAVISRGLGDAVSSDEENDRTVRLMQELRRMVETVVMAVAVGVVLVVGALMLLWRIRSNSHYGEIALPSSLVFGFALVIVKRAWDRRRESRRLGGNRSLAERQMHTRKD